VNMVRVVNRCLYEERESPIGGKRIYAGRERIYYSRDG
jgi:hypothetical protein